MKRLQFAWMIPAAATWLGLEFSPSAIAATFPFEAIYDAEIITIPTDIENVFIATDEGESADAPYGLTNLSNTNYAEFAPATGVFTFGPDPADFGLEGFDIGTLTLFGGANQLFGTISGMTTVDFDNGTGTGMSTITITGGTGLFVDATGTLNVQETDILPEDPTAPIQAQFAISGSIEVPEAVPEPSATAALMGLGIGASLLRRRERP